LQPDTLIPGVESPQSWNRFSYVNNNPVLNNDPTGHECFASLILGLFGVSYSCPTPGSSIDIDINVLTPNSSTGIDINVASPGSSIGIDINVPTPNSSTGIDINVPTSQNNWNGGFSPIPGNDGLSVYMSKKGQDHHIATDKNRKREPKWTEKFENDIFNPSGVSMNDEDNIVYDLKGHQGSHSQDYHQSIYNRLLNVITGLLNKGDREKALRKELNNLEKEIRKDPSILKKK